MSNPPSEAQEGKEAGGGRANIKVKEEPLEPEPTRERLPKKIRSSPSIERRHKYKRKAAGLQTKEELVEREKEKDKPAKHQECKPQRSRRGRRIEDTAWWMQRRMVGQALNNQVMKQVGCNPGATWLALCQQSGGLLSPHQDLNLRSL